MRGNKSVLIQDTAKQPGNERLLIRGVSPGRKKTISASCPPTRKWTGKMWYPLHWERINAKEQVQVRIIKEKRRRPLSTRHGGKRGRSPRIS